MKLSSMLSTTILLVVFSAANGADNFVWFNPVNGKCSDLRGDNKNYTDQVVSAGEWYHQFTSSGEDGDRCVGSHSVVRNGKTFVDLLMYKPEVGHYSLAPLNFTLHPNSAGMYTDFQGGIGYMMATDPSEYFYFANCFDRKGQTLARNVFATRSPVLSDENKKIYEEIKTKLEKVNLLPKMYQIDNTDCPPLSEVVEAKTEIVCQVRRKNNRWGLNRSKGIELD